MESGIFSVVSGWTSAVVSSGIEVSTIDGWIEVVSGVVAGSDELEVISYTRVVDLASEVGFGRVELDAITFDDTLEVIMGG